MDDVLYTGCTICAIDNIVGHGRPAREAQVLADCGHRELPSVQITLGKIFQLVVLEEIIVEMTEL